MKNYHLKCRINTEAVHGKYLTPKPPYIAILGVLWVSRYELLPDVGLLE